MLWEMGISGADLVIAAVGAGLAPFTRFEKVEYANGEEVPAEKFLAEVEGTVLETLLEKVFGVARIGVAAVDGPSRFYILWRYTYGPRELPAGEALSGKPQAETEKLISTTTSEQSALKKLMANWRALVERNLFRG